MQHTLVIQEASITCGNCGGEAILSLADNCMFSCGTVWLFSAVHPYPSSSTLLETLKDQIDEQYPGQKFIGLASGSVHTGTAIISTLLPPQ
jgi:hypothetical protein